MPAEVVAVRSARASTPVPSAPRAIEVNGARAVARAGGLLGAFVVIAAAVTGSGTGNAGRFWSADVGWIGLFAIVGLLLAAAGAALLDLAFLGVARPVKASSDASAKTSGTMRSEILRHNVAAGTVSAGHRASTGIVVGGCLYGADWMTLGVGTAFAALGIATLAVFQFLHRKLTHYADDQEIRGGNTAAALSAAGLAVALSIIVAHAAEGHFTGWASSLQDYFIALALAAALYPVRQILVKRLILGLPLSLRGRALDRAIAEDRNGSLGAVEAITYVATALLITSVL